ncbi:gastrula zinc finger protein XlCGF57.1 isoform X1 [Pleuronectes platessa]|uniref:gastrula zinc finger protein XlCGF57.1 isoform X1 n=1 Tax=Pleuronectes platessa TaxID=8262 RepID=UPI00232A5853|nr:gastrula zinc finger protein XlCGF57.1 isoform X1 [Pleuronectes platessa]
MCAVQLMRASVHERISAAAEDFLLQVDRGPEAARVLMLRPLLIERLKAAAEAIVGLFEETVAEYEDIVQRSEREICRQRRLLDAVLKPEVRLHRADVQQLKVNEEAVPSEYQDWIPSVDQEDSEPPHIKEEQNEQWISQEGEQLQELEQTDIIKFTFTPDTVKTEGDEEETQSSQLYQSQTEEDRKDCGGPEPAGNSGPDVHLQPCPEDTAIYTDVDGIETREPKPVSDMRCTTDKKPLNCSECGKRFSRMYYLKAHMTAHTGEEPFSCSECDKRFTLKEHLKSHLKIHTGEKPFSCSVCGKRFRIKGDMLTHVSVHTGEKPFSCSECGKLFRLKRQLQTHEAIHTGEKPFSCSECGKRFGQKEYLRSHMRTHTGEKPFTCSECGKSYHHQAGLQAHLRNHTGEKPFSCSNCGKRFNQKSCLRVHEKIHTRQQPFSCSECGKRFDHESRLQMHERIHSRDQPFTCLDCGQRFSYKAKLEAHFRVHTGEKPFRCSECGQSFSRKDSLQIHVRLHTGEKPLSCSICDERFSWIYQLKAHQCVGESSQLHPSQAEEDRGDSGGPEPAKDSGPD